MQNLGTNQRRNSPKGRNAEQKEIKPMSKNARRKLARYRLPELMRQQAVERAVDEQLQSVSLSRNEGRRRVRVQDFQRGSGQLRE